MRKGDLGITLDTCVRRPFYWSSLGLFRASSSSSTCQTLPYQDGSWPSRISLKFIYFSFLPTDVIRTTHREKEKASSFHPIHLSVDCTCGPKMALVDPPLLNSQDALDVLLLLQSPLLELRRFILTSWNVFWQKFWNEWRMSIIPSVQSIVSNLNDLNRNIFLPPLRL